jgi:PAS domain S-box-containing protein
MNEDARHLLFLSWMDRTSDGVFLADARGCYVEVNHRGCEMLGRSRDELIGLHVSTVIEPDDLRRRPVDLAALDPTVPHIVQRRLRRADGTTFVAEIAVSSIEGGFYFSIVRDITARREAEEATRRAEQNFRALLDVLPDIVVVHRLGTIVYANATAERVCRAGPGLALVGRPVINLVHPDDRAMVTARIRKMLETGEPAPMNRERLQRLDGTSLVAEVMAVSMVFDGSPAIVVVGMDVTEREGLHARLAVSERLASIGLLAAGVAHEINNPLSYTLLNLGCIAHLTAASTDDPALTRCIDDATEGVRRVQSIVRDLRTFSGALRDEVTTFDVANPVDAALKLADHELRLRARVLREPAPPLMVRANEARLSQVFLNLLVNAGRALPEGDAERQEIRVAVSERRGEVLVTVSDTGAGIAPENLLRLFDPFFTTRAPGQGTGLGLSICHSIVDSLGGRIEVASTVGQGSSFTVILPAAAGGSGPGLAPEPTSPPAPAAPPQERRRLLVVDDELNVRAVLKSLLSTRYEVVLAATGREAQRCLSDGKPWEAVLCDLLMPEVTGMDLYEWMEAQKPELCPRVVFMTGGAFSDRARALLERLPGQWIEKPFEFATLTALIARVTAS